MTLQAIADWSGMSGWSLVLPPSRPDRHDLSRIQLVAADLDRGTPVGVLGSTPEFRDLLFEMGFTSRLALDNSEEFHRLAGAQMVSPPSDTLVLGDWRATLRATPSRYGLLLSDLTAGNIPYIDRRDYYASIAAALRPGGFFIDKHLVNPGPLIDLDQIEAKYSAEPYNILTLNNFNCEAVFCSVLQADLGAVLTSEIYEALARRLHTARLRRFINASMTITPPGRVWYYGLPEFRIDPELADLGLRLVSKASLPPDSPYHGRAFHYIWTKE